VEAFGAHKYLTTWQIGCHVEVIFVPANVFTGVQSFSYWSATTFTASPTSAWLVDFAGGNVGWGVRPTPNRSGVSVVPWMRIPI